MKKLDALIARFADDVIRTVRASTLGELAELLECREAGSARVSLPFPLSIRPAVSATRSRDLRTAEWMRNGDKETSGAELPEVAEITDPERLLRVDGASPASPRRSQRPAASNSEASSRRAERFDAAASANSRERGSGANDAAATPTSTDVPSRRLTTPPSADVPSGAWSTPDGRNDERRSPAPFADESSSSQLLSEPNGEPPPPSAPRGNATVMLRANEALVRSSGAGIVIRRSKRA
jgi:hypothetical protein